MDKYTATEEAYKHGYEKGYEAGKRDATAHCESCANATQEAIVMLQRRIAKQKWIPVTKRLPDDEELVLILCKNGAMFVGYCGKQYVDFERRWRIKTALNSTKLLNLGRVTHWMPLPEPPKEAK